MAKKCFIVKYKRSKRSIRVQAETKAKALTEAANELRKKDRVYLDKRKTTKRTVLPPIGFYRQFFRQPVNCKK